VNKIKEFLQKVLRELESFFIKAGDKGIAALWGGVLSLIVLLVFALSANMRVKLLETEVNKVLALNGAGKVLDAPIPPWRMDGQAMQFGSWWTMRGSESVAVVFPVMRDGIYSPFLGIMGGNGTIEFVPLSGNAKVLYERIAPGIMDVYTRRFRSAAEKIIQGKNTRSRTDK
jgi:hypothetical protein